MALIIKTKAAFRKNIPWLTGLLLGRYPGFVHGSTKISSIPVFVFHQVNHTFENFLRYLSENDYETITADQYCHISMDHAASRDGKKVVLTFDDGHISLWTHAYPLLRKYNHRAISFICPGLVPEPLAPGSETEHILCDWDQISLMHQSGTVDFQLHGMYHNLVFTSPRIIDFFHPAFESHYLGKKEKAVVLRDMSTPSLTNLWPDPQPGPPDYLGIPIFPLSPKYGTDRRYQPDPNLMDRLITFIAQCGGAIFFQQKGWRKILRRQTKLPPSERGEIITGSRYQEELANDLLTGKDIMEHRLPGKKVRHFCFPWYRSTPSALATLVSCGFTSGFLGSDAPSKNNNGGPGKLILVQRLPEQYIFRLPGKNRSSLLHVIAKTL